MSNNIHSYNGYHGTSVEAYEQIRENGFVCDKRDDHWLGSGIYFFLDDLYEACWFSEQCKNVKYKKAQPCILNATITVEENKVLNMDTNPGQQRFKLAYSEIETEFRELGIKLKEIGDDNKMRCVVFDKIPVDEYKVILKVFKNNVPIRNEVDRMLPPTHTQICVRNSGCINNVRRIERSGYCGT